jgi:hypothetical protein
LALGVTALAVAGCGGGDDDDATADAGDKCMPLNVAGEPLVTSGSGQGKAHGLGQLPAETPDGMELVLLVVKEVGASSVWPDDPSARTCGTDFTFQLRTLDPDTYRLSYSVYDPSSDSVNSIAEATSTNEFTITGSEDVEFNPTF